MERRVVILADSGKQLLVLSWIQVLRSFKKQMAFWSVALGRKGGQPVWHVGKCRHLLVN